MPFTRLKCPFLCRQTFALDFARPLIPPIGVGDHPWNQKQVDQGADAKQSAGEEPENSGSDPACIKTMDAQHAKSAQKPQQISNTD